jgi:uncharacterized protein (DUF2235 family)
MKVVLRLIERIAHWLALLIAIAAMIAFGVLVGRPSEKSGNQPNFVGAEQQQKRLAVFLDGTWNSINSNTNVWRMRALCASKSKDGKPQLVYYEVGVNGFLGGVFGQGLDENIRLAYEWLVENYNDGDEIFIFGFSRGAFTARALAGLIAIDGVLKAGSPIGVTELFDRYRKGNEESIWTLKEVETSGDTSKLTDQEKWLLKYSQPAKVKVIGVWDTVGSVGVAAGNFRALAVPSSIICRQDYASISRTAITPSPSMSTALTSLLRSGTFTTRKIRTQSLRSHALFPALNSAGL